VAAGSDNEKMSSSWLHAKYAVLTWAVVRGETVDMAHRGEESSSQNVARSIRLRATARIDRRMIHRFYRARER
jgi:hypothetical protein